MKRIVIILLLIIALIWGYSIIVNGVSIGDFTVYGYEAIVAQSEDLTLDVAAYNKKNTTEFENTLDELEEAIDEYNDAKEEYETLIEEISSAETTTDGEEIIVSSSLPVYEIDFLWTTIGGYAKKEGLVITMDVNQNTSVSGTLGYDLYNLSFLVTGEYIDIVDFLYDIEDDDQLGFEIRDFSMTAGAATFTIYNVPLNSDTLITSSTSTEETTNGTETETDEDETNTTGNTTVSSNSTNSTNTTNSTNSTNNTSN